jgi:hypothetical protein
MVRDFLLYPFDINFFLIILDSDHMKSFFQKVIDNMRGMVEQQLDAVQREGAPEVKVGGVD